MFCHHLRSVRCGIQVLGLQGKLRSRPAGRKGGLNLVGLSSRDPEEGAGGGSLGQPQQLF